MKTEVMRVPPHFEAVLQMIFFELLNGDQWQACSLKVPHADERGAMNFFNNNWTKIGAMAWSCINARLTENGEVKLRVIC